MPLDWRSIPFTRGLLIALAVIFLTFFFTGQGSGPLGQLLPYKSMLWYQQPWTWLTYSLLVIPGGMWLFVLMELFVLYQFGGSLERSWGSRNYGVLFFVFAAIAALAFVPAYYILGKQVTLQGVSLPLVAVVAAWAALDPDLELNYWGIPVRAKLFAAIWVGFTYFQFGLATGDPVLALSVLVGPAAAWLYVRKFPRLNLAAPSWGGDSPRGGRTQSAPPRGLLREEASERERATGFNPLKKRREQMEIDRLKKLLGEDDDDRPVPRGR